MIILGLFFFWRLYLRIWFNKQKKKNNNELETRVFYKMNYTISMHSIRLNQSTLSSQKKKLPSWARYGCYVKHFFNKGSHVINSNVK